MEQLITKDAPVIINARHWRVSIVVAGMALAFLLGALLPASASAQSIYDSQGRYRGDMDANQYNQNSTSNPYGQYGSRYSPDSVNNPDTPYGSRYGEDSPNNPYREPKPRYGNDANRR